MLDKIIQISTIKKLANLAIGLGVLVVSIGAYTRLKDAGLGCPDWPGCYGQFFAPSSEQAVSSVQQAFPQATIEPLKAWIEMIHRYFASILGLIVLTLAFATYKTKPVSKTSVLLISILVVLILFQGLLGMWTVTLKLYPVIVMAHLLGGMSIVAILSWFRLSLNITPARININQSLSLKILGFFCLLSLSLQIALGGWTSANYAALVCPDFPTCQQQLWPEMDWQGAFQFFSVGIFDSPGTPLENTARVTIQVAHRLGAALFTCLGMLLFIGLVIQSKYTRKLSICFIALLGLQIMLGLTNIFKGLPLWSAVAHNTVALLLLITLVTINHHLLSRNAKHNTYI